MKPTGGKITPDKPGRAAQPADIISFPTSARQPLAHADGLVGGDEDFRVLVDGSIEASLFIATTNFSTSMKPSQICWATN